MRGRRLILSCLPLVAALATTALGVNQAWAAPGGPSQAQIAKDLKGTDVVKVTPHTRGAGASKSGGVWYWEQTVEVAHRTKWQGVTKIVRGDVQYEYDGGRWRFQEFRFNSSWYDGLEPPKREEVEAALKTRALKDLLYREYERTVEVHAMALAADPQWRWGDDPDEVSFIVVVEWTTKHDQHRAERLRDEARMDLKRADMKAPWTGLCATEKGCLSGSVDYNHAKHVAFIESPEAEKLQTIGEREKAKAINDALAPLGLPDTYDDLRQFAAATWTVLYHGDATAWKAFEARTGSSQTSAQWVLERADDVRRLYCPQMFYEELIEKPGYLQAVLYDKAHEKDCFVQVQGTDPAAFRVKGVGCKFPDKARADQIAAIPEAEGCKPRPVKPRPIPEKSATDLGFKTGDKVISKWHGNGNEYPGVIGQIEGGRVFVVYEDGDKEWVPTAAIRKP